MIPCGRRKNSLCGNKKIPCPERREIRAVSRNALKAWRELAFRQHQIWRRSKKIPFQIRCQREFGDSTWTRLAASAKVSDIHQE
jgi:hypothetical protein